jgi:hypothetical protein
MTSLHAQIIKTAHHTGSFMYYTSSYPNGNCVQHAEGKTVVDLNGQRYLVSGTKATGSATVWTDGTVSIQEKWSGFSL